VAWQLKDMSWSHPLLKYRNGGGNASLYSELHILVEKLVEDGSVEEIRQAVGLNSGRAVEGEEITISCSASPDHLLYVVLMVMDVGQRNPPHLTASIQKCLSNNRWSS
jgi:hypothetical protein